MPQKMWITLLSLAVVIGVGHAHGDDVKGADRLLCATTIAMECFADGICIDGEPEDWNIPRFIRVDLANQVMTTTAASGEACSTQIQSVERDGVLTTFAGAQSTDSPESGQKTLASTMDVFVFPTEGQGAEQQSKDEATCYSWAVTNTGNDPFDLMKQAEAAQGQADAAIGAGVGLIAARRGRRRAQSQASQQIDQQAAQVQQATAEDILNFKKAFSVCLEAKDYLVKF